MAVEAVDVSVEPGMGFDEALGFTVNQYLFAHRVTREQFGVMLGISRTVAGRKVHGKVGWSARDLAVVADRFGVTVDDLMPTRSEEGWVPAPYVPGSVPSPALSTPCGTRTHDLTDD